MISPCLFCSTTTALRAHAGGCRAGAMTIFLVPSPRPVSPTTVADLVTGAARVTVRERSKGRRRDRLVITASRRG